MMLVPAGPEPVCPCSKLSGMVKLEPTAMCGAQLRVRRSAHTFECGALCIVRTPCLLEPKFFCLDIH